MALKQCKLQQIPQRNKDLTFGYVKEYEKKNKHEIPNMIAYLCLIYWNGNKDTFDPENKHPSIKINGNSVELRNSDTPRLSRVYNCYLENIVNKGTNIYSFIDLVNNKYDNININIIIVNNCLFSL